MVEGSGTGYEVTEDKGLLFLFDNDLISFEIIHKWEIVKNFYNLCAFGKG